MYDTIFIYVPSVNQVIRIAEGTGDNLLDEDIEAGYLDYIYYEQYSVEQDMPEVDGGQVMLTNYITKIFRSMEEAIPSVLDMAYDNDSIEYILLKGEKRMEC